MKKRAKQLSALILCLVMLLAIAPLGCFEAEAATTFYYGDPIDGGRLMYSVYDYSSVYVSDCRDVPPNGVINIPSTANGYTVIGIGEDAFFDTAIKNLNIKSVIIPSTVEFIGDYAFNNCEEMKSINIPDSVTTIGNSAFSSMDGLTSIDIPDSVTSLGEYVLSGCNNLTTVTIGDGITVIPTEAFENCAKLSSVSFGANVETISASAFAGCSRLVDIAFSDNIETIGAYAFEECIELSNITWNEKIRTIDNGAFYECTSLTSVKLPFSLKYINWHAFRYCSSLKKVYIPSSVKVISPYAFEDDDKLTDVYYSGSEAQWNDIDVSGANDPLYNATYHYNSYTHENHTYNITKNLKETCTTDGFYTYRCINCSYSYNETVAATGHSYGAPAWEWANAFGSATAKFTCQNDSTHIETATAAVNSVTNSASCTKDGKTVYTATAIFYGTPYKDTQTVINTPAFGHSYGDWITVTEAKPGIEGKEKRICSTCQNEEEKAIAALPVLLEKLELISPPSTTSYSYKSNISKEGLQINGYYNNGDIIDVTEKVKIKNFDAASVGTKTATAELEGQSVTFNYTVSYTWWQWIIRILLLGIFWY